MLYSTDYSIDDDAAVPGQTTYFDVEHVCLSENRLYTLEKLKYSLSRALSRAMKSNRQSSCP